MSKILLKIGVDISKLNRECRRSLNDVEYVYLNLTGDRDLVITSTYESSDHSSGSLHYAHDAYDIRLPKDITLQDVLVDAIRSKLLPGFDIVLHRGSHIHIEYDPK